MKRYFLVCLFFLGTGMVSAQKKVIDSAAFKHWPGLNSSVGTKCQ